ncbi:MAG: RNA 2',3'-cyclic phosphodiesterase [Actinomycetota bacterium]
MRLFVAIDVPEEIKASIESHVVEPLRSKVDGAKWTRPEGRHLTLSFLGEVEDAMIGDITATLRVAASRHEPFDAAFAELGGFPDLRRPRALWVGVGEGAEAMTALQSDVATSLEPLGFVREDRPFHPHFTLARFRRPRAIAALPSVHVSDTPFVVDTVVLFRSQLHPKGARYTVVERMTMGTT